MLNLKDPVNMVLAIFAVVVGAALERFLTDTPIAQAQNFAKRWHRELFYWSSLIILLSLVLRFFFGATIHLSDTYVLKPDVLKSWDKPLFFKDMVFLIVFGVLLVKAALSQKPIEFTHWLIGFSGVGIFWCILELAIPSILHVTRHSYWSQWWLGMHLAQLAITLFCSRLIRDRDTFWPPSECEQLGSNLSRAQVAGIAQAIADHPLEGRDQFIHEAHERLTRWITYNHGKVMTDGKVYLVETPKQAEELAQKVINRTIDDHGRRMLATFLILAIGYLILCFFDLQMIIGKTATPPGPPDFVRLRIMKRTQAPNRSSLPLVPISTREGGSNVTELSGTALIISSFRSFGLRGHALSSNCSVTPLESVESFGAVRVPMDSAAALSPR